MGRGAAAKERLNRVLGEHLNTIHETFQMLEKTPASSIDRVSWNEVIKIGEQVSKQATTVGMLWTGEAPEMKALEENMGAYFNILQGFLLISYGSTVGAGTTLSSCIHRSMKQVVDSSFMLWNECVASYGSRQKPSIPQFVGTVWDACSALKKAPASNIMAIGRAMTQVAVSLKDVLREMKELKPTPSALTDENDDQLHDSDNNSCSDDDLGNDLSHEEMRIAEMTSGIVAETLVVVKELIRFITVFVKQENVDNNNDFVTCLEKLLKLCQELGAQIDELGACVYPPQEVPAMEAASTKICSIVDEMMVEVEYFEGSSEGFSRACTGLRSSLKDLESELGGSTSSADADLVPKMEKLVVDDN